MARLTIKVRIIAYMVLIGVTLSGFMGVFFPSLLFCWLRARTGSIVPGIVFHGLANVFMNTLEASYGVVGVCGPVESYFRQL